jgi:hypothetical protein
MSRKPAGKSDEELTSSELAATTAEFDQEFVAGKAKPMTTEMRARWESAKAKLGAGKAANGVSEITVRLEGQLLKRCTALAKKKRISRDALIARGLKAILAAEGEEG